MPPWVLAIKVDVSTDPLYTRKVPKFIRAFDDPLTSICIECKVVFKFVFVTVFVLNCSELGMQLIHEVQCFDVNKLIFALIQISYQHDIIRLIPVLRSNKLAAHPECSRLS